MPKDCINERVFREDLLALLFLSSDSDFILDEIGAPKDFRRSGGV